MDMEKQNAAPVLFHFKKGGLYIDLNAANPDKWKEKFSSEKAGIASVGLEEAEALVMKARKIVAEYRSKVGDYPKSITLLQLIRREKVLEGEFQLGSAPFPFAIHME